jgi:hypothetical protein
MTIARSIFIGILVLFVAPACSWKTKPFVVLYEPQLSPINRTELQCLDERTYQNLVRRELEWRLAHKECKAVVDELSDLRQIEVKPWPLQP